jgi:hypothetical protein
MSAAVPVTGTCRRCNGEMWVCEEHPDWPWNGGDGCGNPTDCCRERPFPDQAPTDPCPFIDGCHGGLPCEMAGMPCPDCNPAGTGGFMAAVLR